MPLLEQLLSELHRRGIQTLLVEGGTKVLQSFIDSGLWDEAFVEHGSIAIDGRVPAPKMPKVSACEPKQFFGGNFIVARNK